MESERNHKMFHRGTLKDAKPRCDNCCFSTYAASSGRASLICRQKKGSEGRWSIRSLLDRCENFYPSRAADINNKKPRLIPLTRGKFAIVDADDYQFLSKYTWFAEGTSKHCYAVRKKNGRSIKMHRQIMNAPDHLVVDHIDHNGLNNRKENLRICTFAENCRNIRSTASKTSKYKGVHWNKRMKKWAAQITFENKTYHLGYFTNETAAARAYDEKAAELHGQFASLNFST
jgi:hypothetical protein